MDSKCAGEYIDILVDKKLADIGRAANMVWVCFEGNGELWNLHIQSSWRIFNKERQEIKLASSDIYQPNSQMKCMEKFDWEVQGENLFDEKSAIWLKENKGLCVNNIGINMWGDLRVFFSNDDVLDVFVNTSEYVECWRLFEKSRKDTRHFVVTGLGIDF